MLRILLMDIFKKGIRVVEGLGLGSIASVLRDKGYNVLLKGYYEDEVNYEKVFEFKPDIIGIPIHNQTASSVFKIFEHIRKELPAVHCCTGGYIPTYHADEILNGSSFVDFVIRGEGEYVFVELVSALEKGTSLSNIKGLTYRVADTIFTNENQQLIDDLDSLPFPSREILKDYNLKIAAIEGSRGCSGMCNFCSLHNYWTNNHTSNCPKWRGKSIKRIVDEIEEIIQTYRITRFTFLDSSFENPGSNYKRVWSIANEIIRRNLNISYYVNIRAEFYKIADDQLMDLLLRSGLCGVFIGVESFCSTDVKIYGKTASLEDNIKSVDFFCKYPIHVDIGVINIHPYSTFESLYLNTEFLEKYGYASYFSHMRKLRLFKGTDLYEKIKADGLLKNNDYSDIYRYSFVDKRISQIVDFAEDYFEPLNHKFDATNKIHFYSTDFLDVLVHLKKVFSKGKYKDENAYMHILECEKTIKNILSELNYRNSIWFKKLLNLAETQWDLDYANEIMDEFISKQYIKEKLGYLDNSKVKLYTKLLKLDKEYKSFF